MNKKFLLILTMVLLCICLFAYQNTFNGSSYEYRAFKALQRISGTALPQPTLPVTAEQLKNLMLRMDTSEFSVTELSVFDSLLRSLEKPEMTIRFENIGAYLEANFSAEAFLRTADYQFEPGQEFYYDEDLVYKYRDTLPINEFNAELFLDEYFTGGFFYDNKGIRKNDDLTDGKFHYSFFGKTLDSASPHKAYGSLGYKNINLTLGRDRVSAGNGRTGNLGLGDNFWYEDFAKFSVINYPVSYDFTAVEFATEYTDTSYPDSPYYSNTALWNKDVKDFSFNDPVEIMVQHRLSVSFFNKFTFSMYESMLEYADNALGDIRLLNPFMVLHGFTSFRDGNCNNWFGAELSFNLPKSLEINFQVMFDQIQRPIEYNEDKGLDDMSPNAFGFILNLSKSACVKNGILDAYVEAAVVSHGMYHKELDSGNKNKYPGNVTDLIVGYDDDIQYIGYGLGSNLVALGTGATFDTEKISASLSGIYTIRGNTRKDSALTTGKDYFWKIFPVIDKKLPGNALEHRITISGSLSADVLDFVTVKTTAGFIHATNFRNVKGESFNDFQLSLGVTIHIVPALEMVVHKR